MDSNSRFRDKRSKASPDVVHKMHSEIITRERFSSIINSIPQDASGVGFRRNEVYYAYAREKSGTYKGEPYTKPEHVQISTKKKRFWIKRIDQTLEFSHDPTGGFDPVPITGPDSLLELEGHFIELEDHLQVIERKRRVVTHTEPRVDIQELGAFIETILHWCDKDQRAKVQQTTEFALTSPQQYLLANKEHLALRGIDKPIRHLYVIALVDAMQKIGAAAKVDWKADYETVFRHVSDVANNLSINIQQVTNASTLQTHEILQRFGQDLASQDHVLAAIDIDSDSYVLHIVPSASYSKSIDLAKKIGIKINRF